MGELLLVLSEVIKSLVSYLFLRRGDHHDYGHSLKTACHQGYSVSGATTGATTFTHNQPYSATILPNFWKRLDNKKPSKSLQFQGLYVGDPAENRTRVTAVKGRCLDRLTTGP